MPLKPSRCDPELHHLLCHVQPVLVGHVYTLRCPQLGSTAIGICTKEGVVLAVEKRVTSPLLVRTERCKLQQYHLFMFTCAVGAPPLSPVSVISRTLLCCCSRIASLLVAAGTLRRVHSPMFHVSYDRLSVLERRLEDRGHGLGPPALNKCIIACAPPLPVIHAHGAMKNTCLSLAYTLKRMPWPLPPRRSRAASRRSRKSTSTSAAQ